MDKFDPKMIVFSTLDNSGKKDLPILKLEIEILTPVT